MNKKVTVFVVQATSDIGCSDLFASAIMLKLLANPTVSATAINSLEPSKVTMAEHMHLLTSRSHIIVISFDSLNATRRYLLELKIDGELIDAGKLMDSNQLSKTPVRKIFLACIDQASDIQKVESDIFQALMIAEDALNEESANKATGLPVVQHDGRKKQIEHLFSPPRVFRDELQSGTMGQTPYKANLIRQNIGNCYIENLLNDLDNADV